jgi:hypothetical protein
VCIVFSNSLRSLSLCLSLPFYLTHTLFRSSQQFLKVAARKTAPSNFLKVSFSFSLSLFRSLSLSLRLNKALSPSKLFCFNSALLPHIVTRLFQSDRRVHCLLQFSQVSFSLSLSSSSLPFFLSPRSNKALSPTPLSSLILR